MLRSRRTFCIATTAFVAAISMSLIACGDSSAPTIVDQSMFETACTAENEGMIDSIENHYGKFGYDRYPDYFRCEKGFWVKRESWIRCDKGAQEGDVCIYSYADGTSMTFNEIYAYTSNGGWKLYGGEHDLGKFTIQTDNGRDTAFFKYNAWGGWFKIDKEQYSCFSKFDVQDTCVLETDEGKNYYLTTDGMFHLPVWTKIDSAKVDSIETDSAEVDQALFETPCTAENEGKVDSIGFRTGMYGLGHTFYRCENGSWVKREPWVRCDTKDAQEGDACIYSYTDGSLMQYQDIYVYTGDGVWEFYDKENRIGKFTVRTDDGRKTAYYKNISFGGWKEIDEEQYNCFSKFDYHQDTCVLETNEGKTYYQAASTHITISPIWMKIDYDPELGFCSFYDYQKYGKKDGKHYYCSQGMTALLSESDRFETKWAETELLPRQYSDSRKNGLTDEEFDVLDLPQEASTGDIVGGQLEVCFYNQQIVAIVDTPQVYKRFVLNFCIPQNYYRYENSSWTLDAHYRIENSEWTLQTEDEIAEEEKKNKCTQENEGAEIVTLPSVHIMQPTVSYTPYFTESSALAKPGVINQCISGRKVFKEFTYSRYEVVEEENLNN